MDLQERLEQLYELYAEELAEARAELEGMDTLQALIHIETQYRKALGEC